MKTSVTKKGQTSIAAMKALRGAGQGEGLLAKLLVSRQGDRVLDEESTRARYGFPDMNSFRKSLGVPTATVNTILEMREE